MKLPTGFSKELLQKYSAGKCTEAEKALIETWYNTLPAEGEGLSPEELEIAVNRVSERLFGKKLRITPFHKWRRIGVAASLLFLVSAVAFFAWHGKEKDRLAQATTKDLFPAAHTAILTLADGSNIVLKNDAKEVLVASQGDASIVQLSGGAGIVYKPSGSTSDQFLYNKMTTPVGTTYTLTLSDGTKVWLNAASSISFPATFKGQERSVTVTGEAYFEVAANKQIPFRVTTGNQTVEVLGTQFNINAYTNEEAVVTTLVEGKVKVTKGKETVVLNPGKQSINAPAAGSSLLVKEADLEEAIAWKNGFFAFENATLPYIMRQLSRWYNVRVIYKDGIPLRRFSGKIHRNINASAVLELLSYSKVHFSIENTFAPDSIKTIVVSP